MRRSPDQTEPDFRRLRIFAIDPLVARDGDHQVTVQVRFEELELRPEEKDRDPVSFRGRRVEVVDVDASGAAPIWLKPVELDAAHIAMQHGLEPSESDPQFHQQMVYAVAMRTFEQFDRALGRMVFLRGKHRLRLVPHAFSGGNAFFHPGLKAVLFGYFRASEEAPGENLPGQTIFTCLSHDIVAHEVTHAIVHRLRPGFNVATNPHVRAFHEGFADIVAVFQRLSFRELVHRALQTARGDVRQAGLLTDIAVQFGQGLGSGKALRTALDRKTKIQDVHEEHELGAVLVAAVFEGFYTTYERRSADLVRLATGGTGVLPAGALHPDLVTRLTVECVRTAQSVLTMCIRAFDYLPAADVTFGSFLRALVTADWELNPLDEVGLRAAVIEACRLRGIFAAEACSLAVNALLLDTASHDDWTPHVSTFREWVDRAIQVGVDEERAHSPEEEIDTFVESSSSERLLERTPLILFQASPMVRAEWDKEESSEPGRSLGDQIRAWVDSLTEEDRARLLRLGPRRHGKTVTLFNTTQRLTADGLQRLGLVVQILELVSLRLDGRECEVPTGTTLVIDVTGRVRFVIATPTRADALLTELTAAAQQAARGPMGWAGASPADRFAVDYRGMHQARASS